jgi:hypothetical protein
VVADYQTGFQLEISKGAEHIRAFLGLVESLPRKMKV